MAIAFNLSESEGEHEENLGETSTADHVTPYQISIQAIAAVFRVHVQSFPVLLGRSSNYAMTSPNLQIIESSSGIDLIGELDYSGPNPTKVSLLIVIPLFLQISFVAAMFTPRCGVPQIL